MLRFCRKITEAFVDIGFQQPESPLGGIITDAEDMHLEERMSLWFQTQRVEDNLLVEDIQDVVSLEGIGQPDIQTPEDLSQGPTGDQSAIQTFPRVSAGGDKEEVLMNPWHSFRDFVSSTDAYDWLVGCLRRELYLSRAEPDEMQKIRAEIMASLPPVHGISRKTSSKSYKVLFNLDWSPLAFFESQNYGVSPREVVQEVITLTGACQNAQAATCLQYMKQTWPLTGVILLELIKEMVGGEVGAKFTRKYRTEDIDRKSLLISFRHVV